MLGAETKSVDVLNEERLRELEKAVEGGIGRENFITLRGEVFALINTRYEVEGSAQYGTMTQAQSDRFLALACQLLTYYLRGNKDEKPLVDELVKLVSHCLPGRVYEALAIAYLKNQRYGNIPDPSRAIYFALKASQTGTMCGTLSALFDHIECAVTFDFIEKELKARSKNAEGAFEESTALMTLWTSLKSWVGWFVHFSDKVRLQSALSIIVNNFFDSYLANCDLPDFERSIQKSCELIALLALGSAERTNFYNDMHAVIGKYSGRLPGIAQGRTYCIDAEAPKKETRFIIAPIYVAQWSIWQRQWEEIREAFDVEMTQGNLNACALYGKDIRKLLREVASFVTVQMGPHPDGNEFVWLLHGSFAIGNANVGSDVDCAFLVKTNSL